MTALVEEISTTARTLLRDFPKFFQTVSKEGGRTYDMGHPNVVGDGLYVASMAADTVTAVSGYDVDSRNGMLRLTESIASGAELLVEGYYYEWISPDDMAFYSQIAIDEHDNLGVPLSSATEAVKNVIARYAIVQALWALVAEFSRDIDVVTSESVHIPASQRYRMVLELLGSYEAKYREQAAALNIGIGRMQVLTLRRVSRTTGRLVPVIKPKEIGDYDPWERAFPPIDDAVVEVAEDGDELRTYAYVDTDPATASTYVTVSEP
jgi:hypothetical protein